MGLVQKENELHSKKLRGMIWLLFMVQPFFVYSVGWIAARKHLLSFLFTLWATYLVYSSKENQKDDKKSFYALILYLLGAFSHPINVFWPLWVLIWGRPVTRKRVSLFLSHIFAMLVVISINFYYYQFVFDGHSKFVLSGLENFAFPFFAYGRYILNFIIPFKLAVSYDFYSPLNFVGAIIFIGALFYYFRAYKKSTSFDNFLNRFLWPSYFLILLIPVAINRTDFFISNPYLLNSSITFPLLFLFLEKQKLYNEKVVFYALSFLGLIFISFSHMEARLWEASSSLYKRSYEREKSYRNIRMHLVGLFSQKSIDIYKIKEVLDDLVKNTNGQDPILVRYYSDFSRRLYGLEEISEKAKLKLLDEVKENNPLSFFYSAKIYADQGECEKAQLFLKGFEQIPYSDKLVVPSAYQEIRASCP
jgi:hypothetical protein